MLNEATTSIDIEGFHGVKELGKAYDGSIIPLFVAFDRLNTRSSFSALSPSCVYHPTSSYHLALEADIEEAGWDQT